MIAAAEEEEIGWRRIDVVERARRATRFNKVPNMMDFRFLAVAAEVVGKIVK